MRSSTRLELRLTFRCVRPCAITENGTARDPEDRHKHSLVLVHPVEENLVLQTYYQSPFASRLNMNPRVIRENALRLVEEYDVRTPSIGTQVGSLSDGNHHKVIVARELSRPIHLLIANQPTRALDVGSIEYIHQLSAMGCYKCIFGAGPARPRDPN